MKINSVDFFGVTVTYRVEVRKAGPTIFLSLRSSDGMHIDGAGRVCYEHKGHIFRVPDATRLEEYARTLIPECLRCAFNPDTDKGRALREKFAQKLPLGALITADFDRVAQYMKWSTSTKKEYMRSFELLVSKFDRIPFCEITQEKFALHLREGGYSDYQINGQIYAMRALVIYEETQCLISSHFMDTFAMGNRRVVVGPRDASRHFEKNILTHAQVREIAASCAENLESSRGYLYLGVMLLMTTGITISELCALTWGSFSSSNAYTGVTVIEIGSEAKRVGDVYHIEKLNWPRRRTLPLPPTVAKLYHRVKNNAPNAQENAPFMRSPKNAARRMRPDEFDRWLKGFFKSFDFSKQTELKSLTKNPERTLRATFRSTLESCGCDAEEIRYLCGNAPESVFARNYYAYDDPRELAKLAAVLERYFFSLTGAPSVTLDFKINRSGEDHAIAAASSGRISGDLTVDLSKISHDNLEAGKDLIIDFKSSDSIFVTTELDLEEN